MKKDVPEEIVTHIVDGEDDGVEEIKCARAASIVLLCRFSVIMSAFNLF